MSGSYQHKTRECETCGAYTSVHLDCDGCQKSICDVCATGNDNVYCSVICAQAHCLHNDVRVTVHDGGVCRETGYHDYVERAVCRGCGAEFDDELVMPSRRPAAVAGATAAEAVA